MKRLPLIVFVLGGLSLAASAKPPPDLSVFGLQLGAPLTLPDCPLISYGVDTKKMVSSLCVRRNIANQVYFKETPFMLKEWFLATVYEDKVVGVTLFTDGLDVERHVMSMLTEKYGKPTSVNHIPIQNRLGAHFTKTKASWTFDGLTVTFDSVGSNLDTGEVEIRTPAVQKLIDENLRKWKSQNGQPKM